MEAGGDRCRGLRWSNEGEGRWRGRLNDAEGVWGGALSRRLKGVGLGGRDGALGVEVGWMYSRVWQRDWWREL